MCVVCRNGRTETKDGSRVQNTYKLTTLLHSMYPEPAKVFRNISRQVNIEMSLSNIDTTDLRNCHWVQTRL